MFKRLSILSFLLVVFVFCVPLVGCTAEIKEVSAKELKECTIELVDLKLAPPTEEEMKIDLAYTVHNPNDVPVTLCAVRYDIRVPEFLVEMVANRVFLQYLILPGQSVTVTDSAVVKNVGPYALIWPKLMAGELKVWKFGGVAIIAEKPQFTPFALETLK